MASPVGRPETLFVESPKGLIGYQVFGRSSPDIVFTTSWMTNVDMYWDEPSAIRYFDRLGEVGRILLIDKRGSGVSRQRHPGIHRPGRIHPRRRTGGPRC